MDILFLCIIVFLFLLAIFDLSVGVSNDAVNFLNSAIGAKAASFKRIIIVASIGVFIGAAMSNGMMDIARHSIFRPEYFSFYDLICIFIAVMVTDIILLDIFNSLGLPTSTTHISRLQGGILKPSISGNITPMAISGRSTPLMRLTKTIFFTDIYNLRDCKEL